MDDDGFEWDENKRLTNIEKHSIDFRDIPSAFDSQYIENYDSQNSSHEEQRWKVLGFVKGSVVFFVYTERDGNKRIITARPATKKETMLYYRRFWFDSWS